MNRKEMLLTILAEECSETAKAATKAIRFGSDSSYMSPHTNAEKITLEYTDILAVMQMLVDEGYLEWTVNNIPVSTRVEAKQEKIQATLEGATEAEEKAL